MIARVGVGAGGKGKGVERVAPKTGCVVHVVGNTNRHVHHPHSVSG